MKTPIVVSDSHCDTYTLKHIANIHPDALAYLHAGDSQDYEINLYPFVTVKGNNDYYITQDSKILNIEFLKIYLTHGHKMILTEQNMVQKAKNADCNMFIFGHTHRPFYQEVDGVHLLNPGSTNYSRSPVGQTYAIITLKDDQKIDVTFETI
jgi:putative phosphoesterase